MVVTKFGYKIERCYDLAGAVVGFGRGSASGGGDGGGRQAEKKRQAEAVEPSSHLISSHLEVLHDIKELIVDLWLVSELDLDLNTTL